VPHIAQRDRPVSIPGPREIDTLRTPEEKPLAPAAPATEPWPFDNRELRITERDLPPAGTIVDGASEERWSHLLAPGIRWALRHGASMEIVDPKPIPMEPARVAATERYHGQVRLAADKRSLENYVAGIPFPVVNDDDPDAATKIIWNHQSRIVWDDLDLPKFGCTVGRFDSSGVQVERDYRIGNFRRLFYVGRTVVDPKPTWATGDGLRYREMVDVIEPFEFKGGVLSYNRYEDPARDDDAWLYLPLSRRVRRLSTAQRSEGAFGIDIDLDSYYAFAGNPAWFEWKILGKKTFLAPFHARHEPARLCDKPGDFMFCDTWEPREMYVLSAKSLIPGYNFSRRILYVDAQSHLIPYNEVYDLDGQLWRTLVLQWKAGLRRSMPYSTEENTYEDETAFVGALLVYDMQGSHSTYCSFPAGDMAGEESAYYWRGSDGSTTPDKFDISAIVAGAR
jgi:hypothetical protein